MVDTLEKAIVIIEKEMKGTSFNLCTAVLPHACAPLRCVSAHGAMHAFWVRLWHRNKIEGMGQSGVAGEQVVTRSSHQVTAEIEAPKVHSMVLGADTGWRPSRPKAVIASLAN